MHLAWLNSIWEKLLNEALSSHFRYDFLYLTFRYVLCFQQFAFFSLLAHLASKEAQLEPLTDTKIITPAIKYGWSIVHLYCGNILNLNNEVDVILTSEYSDINLGVLKSAWTSTKRC